VLSPVQRRAAENALRHAQALSQLSRHAIGLEKALGVLLAGDGDDARLGDLRPGRKETATKTS
jgi:hypothetical protein